MTKPKPTQAKLEATDVTPSDSSATDPNLYAGFVRWTSKKRPQWHDVKKMRYVFWRMMSGITVKDAIREIHWHPVGFWHLVNLERNDPFYYEYKRAQIVQSRMFSDSVHSIAEGRDRITRRAKKDFTRVITRATKKLSGKKTSIERKLILSQLMGDLREHDKIVMTRNKMQMEAAKWIAKTANPAEFGEKTSVGFTPPGPDGAASMLRIEFIGTDKDPVEL